MTDIKSDPLQPHLREEDVRQAIELLFFAYRDFTAEPDAILAKWKFGRAHHRVIYFVGRHPQISVTELLAILRITKQSLSRVLGQLVKEAYIVQRPGLRDRRQRLLELTDRGKELEGQLSGTQRALFERAYRSAGASSIEGFRKVLLGMINETDRRRFPRGPTGAPPASGAR